MWAQERALVLNLDMGGGMNIKLGKRAVLGTLAVAVCIWPLMHLGLTFDPSYDVASSFVKANPLVAQVLGSVKKSSLAFFARSYVSVKGAAGSASYKLTVKGVKKTGDVQVDLQLHGGSWQVTRATLRAEDDQKISLVDTPVE